MAYMALHNTCMRIHRHLVIMRYTDHKQQKAENFINYWITVCYILKVTSHYPIPVVWKFL